MKATRCTDKTSVFAASCAKISLDIKFLDTVSVILMYIYVYRSKLVSCNLQNLGN